MWQETKKKKPTRNNKGQSEGQKKKREAQKAEKEKKAQERKERAQQEKAAKEEYNNKVKDARKAFLANFFLSSIKPGCLRADDQDRRRQSQGATCPRIAPFLGFRNSYEPTLNPAISDIAIWFDEVWGSFGPDAKELGRRTEEATKSS